MAQFRTRNVEGGTTTGSKHYAVARDGRFLINQPVGDAAAPVTLILNWNPEAKQ